MSENGPSDWSKAVDVASYRLLGYTQQEVAAKVGIAAGTISRWENSDWWHIAMAEASNDEIRRMSARALGVIDEKLEEGCGTTARWFLERTNASLSKKGGNTHAMQDGGASRAIEGGARDAKHDSLEDLSDDELRALAGEEPEEDYIDAQFEQVKDKFD